MTRALVGEMTPNNNWDRRGDDKRFGALERGLDVLKERVDNHDDWVKESKEFHKQVNNFITSFNAVEAERDKQQKERHEQNTWKLNFIGVCVAIATAAILAATAYIAWKSASQHAFLDNLISRHDVVIAQSEVSSW